jgi:hypothetical protein
MNPFRHLVVLVGRGVSLSQNQVMFVNKKWALVQYEPATKVMRVNSTAIVILRFLLFRHKRSGVVSQ